MVNYRLIGTGVTNSQGVATCEYTGTGKGEVDFVASLDDASHISESSLQSEIYATFDTLFYQNSTLATWGKGTNVDFTNGIASNSSSSTGYLAPSLNGTVTDTRKWNTDLCIEFEFVKGTGNMQIQLNDGTHNVTRYLTEDCTVRIECKSSGTSFIFNGGTPITQDALTGTFLLRFIVWANSSNTIKNLKIYPI